MLFFFGGWGVLSMVSTKFIHEYLVFLVIFFLLLLNSRITTLILIHTWLFGELIESMDRLPTDYLLYSFPAAEVFLSDPLCYFIMVRIRFYIPSLLLSEIPLSLYVFQHLKAHQFPNENLLFPWLSISIPLLLYSLLFITATLLPDITEQFWIKFEVKASYKTNLLYYYLS